MPLGALAVPGRVTGAQPQHPRRILELSSQILVSAQRGGTNRPQSASHFPLEGTGGWKLQVPRCYLRGQVSPAKPREPAGRAGAIAPGPRRTMLEHCRQTPKITISFVLQANKPWALLPPGAAVVG